ncbi:hypothetical protein TPHA_0B04120 [Tetrapisispora phaffii CBS 4417]|uniref:Pex N-terminal domain-containing protein n=1 Tax=Tetrapisispora phaffii (strain ATCC 24235 / CBS 4417 / NBRC 1672 / NRRL Y-8282 / UCD 70-5) TaxID=1071381 RepID=G8BQ01_TETPH|nr:hypothetical protein TPHA_0B04120 [Tetrapisispora phaffii CBS 4417]CCE62082.1 hypothetical protein TPHA_0B04120 [Tetrapisispora phaffii CBS 4417]
MAGNMRAAHFDALELRDSLDTWFKTQLGTDNREALLLADTLFFNATNQSHANGTTKNLFLSLTTEGAYSSSKRLLFLMDVVGHYVIKRLHSTMLTVTGWPSQIWRQAVKFYGLADLLNFLFFLNGATSISPLYTLCKVHITLSNAQLRPEYYQNSMLASVQLHNRQLLWNSVLELFSILLLNPWFNTRLRRAIKSSRTSPIENHGDNCMSCGLFPTNTHFTDCCSSLYCYACVLDTLDLQRCIVCHSNNFKALPYY